MIFSSGFFGALLTGSNSWEILLDKQTASVTIGEKRAVKLECTSITSVQVLSGALWAKIQITSGKKIFNLDGIVNEEANQLKLALVNQISINLDEILKENRRAVISLIDSTNELLTLPKYLARSDLEVWIKQQEVRRSESIKKTLFVLRHPYLSKSRLHEKLRESAAVLFDIASGNFQVIQQRNNKFVENELLAHKTFFDSVESSPLTREQCVASVVMEDRNLLVAAAGSGKTSVVVGKIGYVLLKKLVLPEDILVLAFNTHAVGELESRIHTKLGPLLSGSKLKVKTFHALGMEIIGETTGKKPSISNFAAGVELSRNRFIQELIDKLLDSNPEFFLQWVMFLSLCRKPAQDPQRFETIEEWDNYVKNTGDYQNGKSGYLTLNGELVKSQGELAIANWLFIKGVSYEYERPYKYETADRKYRQYQPDFYFNDIDCYLEHYALDAQGNPPAAFGEKYLTSIEWKRHLHLEKGTEVFETTFAEFISGVIFEKLEFELVKRGIQLKPRSTKEILDKVNQPSVARDIGSLLLTFIKHAKSNELKPTDLKVQAEQSSQPYRAKMFASLAGKILEAYQNKLDEKGEIDFEDLIVNAANYAAAKDFKHSYKLILVDEFQDISRARAKLLQSLLSHANNCKFFAVGDDWQSIYRFAGSDLDVFKNFESYFGFTATNYLTQTFRCNQGIADIAANFVLTNPSQMAKKVKAQDATTNGVIVIRQYERLNQINDFVKDALNEIVMRSEQLVAQTVFILSRYRNQSPAGLSEWQEEFSTRLNIIFSTIHSSKGLQADYVILIGLHTRNYAFPSEIADDPLLHMVMPAPELFSNAEERRLFYVALTRARHKVYLFGGKFTPSNFLDEVKNMNSSSCILNDEVQISKKTSDIKLCPKCKIGHLSARKGKYGIFLGCSNFPSCEYTCD